MSSTNITELLVPVSIKARQYVSTKTIRASLPRWVIYYAFNGCCPVLLRGMFLQGTHWSTFQSHSQLLRGGWFPWKEHFHRMHGTLSHLGLSHRSSLPLPLLALLYPLVCFCCSISSFDLHLQYQPVLSIPFPHLQCIAIYGGLTGFSTM